MRGVRIALSGCLILALVGCSGSSTGSSTKDKLIGTWEVVKINDQAAPAGASMTIEFTKDGKAKMSNKRGDKVMTDENTYEVDGMKINTVEKKDGKEKKETMLIKTLTDKELVVEGEGDNKGMKMELKRK